MPSLPKGGTMPEIDAIRQKFEMLRTAMDERMTRLWAATEALTSGWGGVTSVAKATGLSHATIRAGVQEVTELGLIPNIPVLPEHSDPRMGGMQRRDRIRRPGGGRKLTEIKDPAIVPSLNKLLTNEVAGDPMVTGHGWSQQSSSIVQMAEGRWASSE